jgi:hypothetical protein
MNWVEAGRFLVIAGSVILVIGLILLVSDKLPLGRLPGDIRFGGERFRVYIPLTTCILLSILVTLVLNFFTRR